MFFFNDTATTEIYTLSLHDALPICTASIAGRFVCSCSSIARSRCALLRFRARLARRFLGAGGGVALAGIEARDRKSTRLNSSHANISYAVFCLKKKQLTHHPLLPQR